MPENTEKLAGTHPEVYLWLTDDVSALSEVLNYVKRSCNNKQLEVLRTECATDDLTQLTLLGFILDTLRRFNCLSNSLTTVLSVNEHFQAVQLCVARANYDAKAEFNATAVEVVCTHNKHVRLLNDPASVEDAGFAEQYADFLRHSNVINQWELLKKLKESRDAVKSFLLRKTYFVYGSYRTEFVTECLKVLGGGTAHQVHVEVPLDASLNVDLKEIAVEVHSETISNFPVVNEPVATELSSSKTGEYLTCIFNAIIRVLLNSRDELALATTMASPLIQLPHDAFTELKRVSLKKGMPMCQCAISYVLRLRLGNPVVEDDPLRRYVCGLAEFVDLLHKLQTIIEEEESDAAVQRVIGVVVSRVRRSTGFGLNFEAVMSFKGRLLDLVTRLSACEPTDETNVVGKEALWTLRNVSDFLSTRQVYCNVSSLFCFPKHEGTPLNVVAMLAYFKTPDPEPDEEDEQWNKPLSVRIQEPKRVSAFRTVSENVQKGASCANAKDTPPGLKETAESSTPNRGKKVELVDENSIDTERRGTIPVRPKKRSILSEMNGAAKRPKKSMKNTTKSLPLNQRAITSFFCSH